MSTQLHKIPAGLWFPLTSRLLAAQVTLLLVLLSETLWLCAVKQLGSAFCDGYGFFSPIRKPYIPLRKCLQLGCDAGDQKQPGSCLQGEVQASARSSAELPAGQ